MNSIKSALQLTKRAQYKLRRNVGLDRIESSGKFKDFEKKVKWSLDQQVSLFLENPKVIEDSLLIITKEADVNLVQYIGRFIISFKNIFQDKFGEDKLHEFYEWVANEAGQSVLDRMGVQVDFVLRNESVSDFLRNFENYLIQNIDQTTKERIANIITEGRDGFLNAFEIAQLIKEKMIDITRNRAETIARTELANAFNAIEFETFKRNNVSKVRWVTVIDERVCPICEPLHNKETSLNSGFSSDSFAGLRPPAHPNCRCFLEEVLTNYSVQSNRIVWSGE